MDQMVELSVYIHVPFCTKKCDYCHFYVIPNKPEFHKPYLETLLYEIQAASAQLADKKIVSVYFGGGTPSLLAPAAIAKILEQFELPEDCEITLEANPEKITQPLAKEFCNAGINRMSLGMQSFDNQLLTLLSRSHTSSRSVKALWDVVEAGIGNISIDLMYDLPTQTMESWCKTLKMATELPITHLSLYNLTIEPHTSFFKRAEELKPLVPKEELSLQLLEEAIETFDQAGLKRYEISAFCKLGFESRHNLGYWQGRPFLGFGPSAYSYYEGARFRKTCNFQRWKREVLGGEQGVDFHEKLSRDASEKEMLAVGLRVLQGVDLTEKRFTPETEGTIKKLIANGLLERTSNRLRLTKRGSNFYDLIAQELM